MRFPPANSSSTYGAILICPPVMSSSCFANVCHSCNCLCSSGISWFPSINTTCVSRNHCGTLSSLYILMRFSTNCLAVSKLSAQSPATMTCLPNCDSLSSDCKNSSNVFACISPCTTICLDLNWLSAILLSILSTSLIMPSTGGVM